MQYLNVTEVESAMQGLSDNYPSTCELIALPEATHEGRTTHAVRIGLGPLDSRPAMLFIGGQHAREWGSSDICINVAADLLEAYDLGTGLAYGGTSFTAAAVRQVVEDTQVFIFPLVNPDGRYYSQTVDPWWRKNRNPVAGVDLNRNYDFLWDFKTAFHPDAHVAVSDDPTFSTYHGEAPHSEPETRNVVWLLDTYPQIQWMIDIHSYGGLIYTNWGHDENQTTDPDQNFLDPAYDGLRGEPPVDVYDEYIRPEDLAAANCLASRMQTALHGVRSVTYKTGQMVDLYPTTGNATDYPYSRHYADPSKTRTLGFLIEWGQAFQPPLPEMEAIIADVSAALLEFAIAAPCDCSIIQGHLEFPVGDFPSCGAIEAGYRARRRIEIPNVGTVPTVLRARILAGVGGDFDPTIGFGLADASDSLTSSVGELRWTVLPQTQCGSGPTGDPQTVQVNFHATAPNSPPPGADHRQALLHVEQLDVDDSGDEVAVQTKTYVLNATVVEPRALDIAAVFDRSGSMAQTTGMRVKAAAAAEAGQLLVELMRADADDRAALVRYNQNPDVIQPITHVSSTGPTSKQALAAMLDPEDDESLQPAGATSIAGGVMTGLDELATPRPDTPANLHRAVVTLTDGKDNRAFHDPDSGLYHSVLGGPQYHPSTGIVDTVPVEWTPGVRGFAIGIGSSENVSIAELQELTTVWNGDYFTVDSLEGENLFALEKYFLQIFMRMVGSSLVSDPTFVIGARETRTHSFNMLRGDVSGLVTIFDARPRLPFRLLSPLGEVIDADTAPAGFVVRSGTSPTARFVEFTVPQDEPERYAGEWTVEVVGVADRKEHHGVVPHVVYGLSIGAGSNVRLEPHIGGGTVAIGDPIVVTAALTEAGLPLTDTTVEVEVRTPSGNTTTWMLDPAAGSPDGTFTATYDRTNEGGSYLFTFRAEGRNADGEAVHREATIASYVHGPLSTAPLPTGQDQIAFIQRCCATLTKWLAVFGIGMLLIIVLLLLILLTG